MSQFDSSYRCDGKDYHFEVDSLLRALDLLIGAD